MRMKAIANVAFDFCAVSFLGKGALHLVKAYGSEALRRLEKLTPLTPLLHVLFNDIVAGDGFDKLEASSGLSLRDNAR